MKHRFEQIDPKWKAYALAGCVCAVFCVILFNLEQIFSAIGMLLKVFSSVFIGFVIAYILNPFAKFFYEKPLRKMAKRKPAWIVSVVLSIVIVLGFISLLLRLLVPQIFSSIKSLIDNVGVYSDNIIAVAQKFGPQAVDQISDIMNIAVGENGALTKLGNFLIKNLQTFINATGNFSTKVLNFLIGFILAVYFLCSKENIGKLFRRFGMLVMSPLRYTRTKYLLEKFNSIFSEYIIYELLDALIIGVLNFAFMLATGMPDAALISVLIAVTNLAPTFGPIVGAIIGAFILLLITPSKVLLFLIFTVALQTVDAYIIKPKLFGAALNVPGVLILISIIVCGQLFGIVGVLLAIPIAAFLVYLYSEVLIPWLELRRDFKAYKKELSEAEHKLSDSINLNSTKAEE